MDHETQIGFQQVEIGEKAVQAEKTTRTTVWRQGSSGHVKRTAAELDFRVQLGGNVEVKVAMVRFVANWKIFGS